MEFLVRGFIICSLVRHKANALSDEAESVSVSSSSASTAQLQETAEYSGVESS